MNPAHPESPNAPPRAGLPEAVRPADYRDAAAARLGEAQRLLDTGSPGMALYLAGVAAECVLRSELPMGLAFDGRHDLERLQLTSRLAPAQSGATARRRHAVSTVSKAWRNSFRYMPDAKIARVLHRHGFARARSERGLSLVIRAARQVVAAAQFLYDSTRGGQPQEAPDANPITNQP